MLQEAKCLFFCAHFFIEIVRSGSLSYNLEQRYLRIPEKSRVWVSPTLPDKNNASRSVTFNFRLPCPTQAGDSGLPT